MNNGEKTCHQVKSYKICCKSSFNVKSTENTVKDTRFTQISTTFNPSHFSSSRSWKNIEIGLDLEKSKERRFYFWGNTFLGTFLEWHMFQESESRSESSQNRDALKTQKLIDYLTYLYYPLDYFLPSSIWVKNKEFNFSQFDTFNFVICVKVSCCDKFSAYTTESKQNNTTSRYFTCTCTVNSTRKHLKNDYLFDKTL